MEREYIVNGKHLIINDRLQTKEIRKKLGRILVAEMKFPNRFEQKITFIKQILEQELGKIK